MSDNNLPPLPETYYPGIYNSYQMREYAAVAVAERDAEIARLRRENKALQDGIVRDFVDVGIKNAITELRTEIETLKADAERYRWLRDNMVTDVEPDGLINMYRELRFRWKSPSWEHGVRQHPVPLDTAIDNARSKE